MSQLSKQHNTGELYVCKVPLTTVYLINQIKLIKNSWISILGYEDVRAKYHLMIVKTDNKENYAINGSVGILLGQIYLYQVPL